MRAVMAAVLGLFINASACAEDLVEPDYQPPQRPVLRPKVYPPPWVLKLPCGWTRGTHQSDLSDIFCVTVQNICDRTVSVSISFGGDIPDKKATIKPKQEVKVCGEAPNQFPMPETASYVSGR